MSKIIIGREYPKIIIPAIKEAKNAIDILVYDWRWYENNLGSQIQKFNQEILNAVRRGVSVRALVNNNYVPSILSNEKLFIKRVNTSRIMHIKLILIDQKKLFIGSHNLTQNAFELNHEISVLIEDIESISRCLRFFETLCHL
jgi:phosphatidylserine/phosphatidylglycerophosphate/cardiolipin synthase-like enzyme